MASWDKDIHRIKEIQELLENRQRYFRGHLKTSFYKLDPNGNPLYFPKLRAPHIGSDSNEPSIGHSLGATFGSTETGSYDPALNFDVHSKDIENKRIGKGLHSDSSEGNRADHSQNESSGDSARLVRDVVEKKKVLKKNSKVLRKWVNRNLEVASSITQPTKPHEKQNLNATENKNSRKSSIIRFKSISIDDNDKVPTKEEMLPGPTPLRPTNRKKSPSPMKLLRRKSWMFKAEVASRLNENANDLNFNKVIPGLSKTSISLAREKLKKAEKLLRATVRNEQSGPLLKKLSTPKKAAETKPPKLSQARLTDSKQKVVRKPSGGVPNRLAMRHQEEALKNDLNLREAFAMIKIDPEPLLKLASTDSETMSSILPKTRGGVGVTMQTIITRGPLAEQKFRRSFALEDSTTTQSLRRLKKLSIQHLQKQHSLIPNAVQPLQIPKGTKKPEGKTKNSTVKNIKPQKKAEQSIESTRRKSQANILNQQHVRRRSSNNFSNGHT